MKYPVLLLDDDYQWLTIYSKRLPQKQYTIESTTSLPYALERLHTLPYPVIIADLRLIGFGNTGGFKLLDEARKNNRYTKVIIITAYGGAATAIANKAIENGAFNYFTKPIVFTELDECISTAIIFWEQEINESISLGFLQVDYVSQLFNDSNKKATSCLEKEDSIEKARVFISYSHFDYEKVKMITDIIQKNGISVWFDEEQIKLGDSVFSKINEAIQKSKIMLIILSKEAINSGWLNEEMEAMFNRCVRNKKLKIIPILLDNVEIPPLLASKKALDLQNNFKEKMSDLIQMIKNEIESDR